MLSILLSTFVTYGCLKEFYIKLDEKQLKTYITTLLTTLGENFDHIEESLDWTIQNFNLTFSVHDNVESLLAKVPPDIDNNRVISDRDIQQLEKGNTVINKVKTHDLAMDLLLFTHPIIKDNKIENLLFLHVPANNMEKNDDVFALLTISFAMLSIMITIMFAIGIFGKSYRQLQQIKLAALEVSNGNFDAKIDENSKDEVGEITEVFNMMSTKLKEEKNQTKEFMEDFSHEIKTPFTLAKNYNQALIDGIIQDPKEQQKCYHLIDRELNKVQKLIQHFLDVTKLNAQSVKLVKQPIVFAQTVENIMSKYELLFKENNIKLDLKLDYDVIISADEDGLEHIIQNIVHNAIKYSPENPSIQITMERNETSCILAISDNGVGLSEEHLSLITNRFVRVNKVHSRKEASTSTGLGLSIVEKLMDLHEGKVIIESQSGVGTTVKLVFPIVSD